MTKKTVGKRRVPKMPGGREWDLEDQVQWGYMCRMSPKALREWAIIQWRDFRDLYRQLDKVRRLRAEESEFYKRELAAAKRENLGRIQSNLLQTVQNMMAALEGNSRSVHALAEPVGELLVTLRNEMDKDRDRDRAMEKAQRLGLQFGMSADRVAGSGIPSHWPQPGEGKK